MRILISCVLLIALQANAQLAADFFNHSKQITQAEKDAHARLSPLSPAGTAGNSAASTNFDVKYYRCEWEVDPAVRYIKGKVTVYYLIKNATADITFDLTNTLIADSVKQRNTTLNNQHANNALQIFFPATVNSGVLDSVSIYYNGVPANTGFGSFINSQHAGIPVVWSLSEPYGARDWWPCKNGNDDKADSLDVLLTVPAQYTATSNGLLQSESLTSGGTKKTSYFKHRYPIATYLICFAVTNYTVFNRSVQLGNITLPVVTYCYPESNNSFQASTFHVLEQMKFYHNLLGDYPFINEKYGHTQFGWGGGMEHQTNSFIVVPFEGLQAHELAHQWFGDKITCNSWEDIWLNEGFASHMVFGYYAEKYYPNDYVNFRKSEIEDITSQPGGSVKVDDTSSVNRIFDGRLTYNKGSHLLHMLRLKLTDSVFLKGLRTYLKDPALAYGFTRTSDFKKHLEAASGKNLTEFFNDWYSGQGYPTYNVQWTPVGSSRVKIKINQTTSHPSVNFFELPVPIKLKNATQQKTILLDNTSNGQEFLENIGFTPDSIFIDPEYWLISKNNIATKVADNNVTSNSVTVFPNPIKTQFSIWLRNFTATTADVALYNTAGQRLFTQKVALVNGGEYIDIQSANLPAGMYTLRITAGSFKYTKKLVKQF
jgi:aminopeptidase N